MTNAKAATNIKMTDTTNIHHQSPLKTCNNNLITVLAPLCQ